MIQGLTERDAEVLSSLVVLHSQKVMDYTKAVPNRGMANRHGEFVETLRKLQTAVRGETPSCSQCVREGKEDAVCLMCGRSRSLKDNFKRRQG